MPETITQFDEDDSQGSESVQNAWAALRMIRQTIEELGPSGILPSEEDVLALYGPEPVHEATVIVEALRKLLAPAGGARASAPCDPPLAP